MLVIIEEFQIFFWVTKAKLVSDLIFASEYLPDENLRANAKSYLQIN